MGKSTIVNALVGMDIAKTDDDVVSVTEEIGRVEAAKNGVHVHITDVPGLGYLDVEDDSISLKHSKDIDLFLFCLKMTERLDRHDIDEIKTITNTFGADIWKKGIFILTYANKFDEKEHFTSKLHEWESEIRKRIKKIFNTEVAEKIPIVPTGFKEPQLPDRPSWLSELWIQGFRRMGFNAKYYLAVLNIERIGDEIDEKKFAEEMYGNRQQPQITHYQERRWKEIRYVGSKYIGPIFGGVFFSIIAITVFGVHPLLPLVLYAGACMGDCIVLDTFGCSSLQL